MYRSLTPGANNTFWVQNPTRFLLERYDYTGRLLAQGRHELSGWYKEASERRPPKKASAKGQIDSTNSSLSARRTV